jgi:hypothetical protein
MHYPGHLRESFHGWLHEGCPPLASVEVNYVPTVWTAERLLRRMLNCSDFMPGDAYREAVERFALDRSRRQTYGSVARVLLDRVNAAAV